MFQDVLRVEVSQNKMKEEGEEPSPVYADSGNEFELCELYVCLHVLKTSDTYYLISCYSSCFRFLMLYICLEILKCLNSILNTTSKALYMRSFLLHPAKLTQVLFSASMCKTLCKVKNK